MTTFPVKILADASLPDLNGLFPASFVITYYHSLKELQQLMASHSILLCRSTISVNEHLLNNTSIRCVATASSGTDHIDVDYLKEHDITLFDAKGSNAEAVVEYVLSILAALSALDLPVGSRAGVIGLGEVGSRVADCLKSLNYVVSTYDPYKPELQTSSLDELTSCDFLCLHANLHNTAPYPSFHLINRAFFQKLKAPMTIINAARGNIVDETDLIQTPQRILYCTDVYSNEPNINAQLINLSTLCTPHIAGHTIEAKYNAVVQVSKKIIQYCLNDPYLNPTSTNWVPDETKKYLNEHWQQDVLKHYNPIKETETLKSAKNKKEAFLKLRQSHHRHALRTFVQYP